MTPLDFFVPAAHAQDAAQQANPMFSSIAMFGGLFLLMYFILIRPQKKRQKEHQALIGNLGKGDEIVLTSGLLGKITKLDDDYVTVDSGSVEQRYQRVAVHAVLPKGTLKGLE